MAAVSSVQVDGNFSDDSADGAHEDIDDALEAEQDEEQEHLESSQSVPHSTAPELADLQTLGIVARDADGAGYGEDLTDPASEELPVAGAALPAHWFVSDASHLQGLDSGAITASASAMHAFIRSVGCPVEFPWTSASAGEVMVFAIRRDQALRAQHLLQLPRDRLQEELERIQFESQESLEGEDVVESDLESEPFHTRGNFTHLRVRPRFLESAGALDALPFLSGMSFSRGRTMDPVQLRAMSCLAAGEAVMFCAPTSAGKTAVAEYALETALRSSRRSIYTTPIKALSNQKYKELSALFGPSRVGILTGDTTIASDAPVVVMTMEILQAMLYRQARDPLLLDDFACVVVDEAHFLGNEGRGFAWEEVMIMLPSHLQLILLSATVPNSRGIAQWIASMRVQAVNVVETKSRPVPLRHEVYRCGHPSFRGGRWKSFFPALNSSGRVNRQSIRTAAYQRRTLLQEASTWWCPEQLIPRFIGRKGQNLRALEAGRAKITLLNGQICVSNGISRRAERDVTDDIESWLLEQGVPAQFAKPPRDLTGDPHEMRVEDLDRLLGLLYTRKQLPCIGFCFDRLMCERVALLLTGGKRLDFATRASRQAIKQRLDSGLSSLEEGDKRLAQVRHSRELLLRGIGVHHSGMLPILRELVELLFAEGLLPVVFATETFAIGLNMPAKSVIFMDLVKFDGQRRRLLNAGEFAQMAGRAGRRGKDPQGHVYVMLHSSEILQEPVEYVLEDLYSSSAPQVSSCFRLRWSSLLHLISTGLAHLYAMLTNSLLSYADPSAAQELKDEAERKIRALQAMNFVDSSCSALPKGTLACHFFVPDDGLLVSEIVLALRGFIGLSAAQIFAVCACFVAEGRHPNNWKRYISDAKVKESIATCKSVARQMACRLHGFSLPCFERCDQLTCGFCDGAAFAAAHVNPSFAETAYRWARGDDFTEAVLQSRVPVGGEGIVVRTLRRLDELMREVTFVLRHDLGATQVADSIREARLQARRGVVAMQSAYLGEQDDLAGEELEPEPPFPQQLLPLGPGWLDPLDIMFSQGHCAAKFRRPIETSAVTAASILELAQALAHGELDVSQFSLEIYWFRHRFYSLGNRRLAAFRLWRLLLGTPLSVPVVVVDKSRAVKRHWLSKFTTGFTGGRKIRVTHTGEYIGMSREQSTYGQSLWSP